MLEKYLRKFTGAEVINDCPNGGRSSVLDALKNLVEEGIIEKRGTGRATYYVRIDSKEWWFRPNYTSNWTIKYYFWTKMLLYAHKLIFIYTNHVDFSFLYVVSNMITLLDNIC